MNMHPSSLIVSSPLDGVCARLPVVMPAGGRFFLSCPIFS